MLIEGRTAEELVFHEISTGAHDDLARATDIARSRVMRYGMSEKLGPLTYKRGHRPQFLDPPPPLPQLKVSEETARDIDCEVRTLIAKAHEHAQKILETGRDTLDTLAHLLLKKETIKGDEAASDHGCWPPTGPRACDSYAGLPAIMTEEWCHIRKGLTVTSANRHADRIAEVHRLFCVCSQAAWLSAGD